MSELVEQSTSHCKNCGHVMSGEFCAFCGQSVHGPDRFFLSLVNEVFENLFQMNSRARRTLYEIFFKPGRVPKSYLSGKRASYVRPLRFYIVTSISFFLILSVLNYLSSFDQSNDSIAAETTTEEVVETPPVDIQILDDDAIDLPFVDESQQEELSAFLHQQAEKARTQALEDPSSLADRFLEMAPILMFLMLPIIALFLKIILFRHRFYYAEHLIFVVYNYCFLFLALSTAYVIDAFEIPYVSRTVEIIVGCWIPIYLVLSFKRVYDLSKLATLIAVVPLFVFNFLVFAIGVLTLMLIGLVTL